MLDSDDTVPQAYPYYWSKQSQELTVDQFLTKYRPSMVQNDGTKPWIWVAGDETRKPIKVGDMQAAITEATATLKDITERVESIKNDDSIPIRSSKKTGAKSKKEVREQAQAEATEKLKETAVRHGYVCGKWLIFAPSDKVDIIWRSIAASLVSGPLASTSAFLTKVSTSPKNDSPNYQHVICVYIPDVYDQQDVTEVMKVLLRNHGATLSGVKSDLYTHLGIDSKHPSGLQSTIWKNTALLKDSEIKELKDGFYADLNSAKAESAQKPAGSSDTAPVKTPAAKPATKPGPKLKKKANDDPFASDDDEGGDEEEAPMKQKKPVPAPKAQPAKQKDTEDVDDDGPQASGSKPSPKAKGSKPAPKKVARKAKGSEDEEAESEFHDSVTESDDDYNVGADDDQPKRRSKRAPPPKARPTRSTKRTQRSDDEDDNDDDFEEKPKRKRPTRR
ncbi:hypothetical protein BDN72DRAFT_833995 [Pluteus cervinus]|uniref:Uncharacterized protein n=1 Tax=Pluteus cervinus TaxID=181527 RepID=A0ACD3B7E0_9AGAR|nr:hypothetical protein BDN72DRAFT_833995 [Pluteus cervinus]